MENLPSGCPLLSDTFKLNNFSIFPSTAVNKAYRFSFSTDTKWDKVQKCLDHDIKSQIEAFYREGFMKIRTEIFINHVYLLFL